MSVPTIVLEFVFDEEIDEDGFRNLELAGISRVLDGISPEEAGGIVEGWSQSDRYWVDYTRYILIAIDEGAVGL